MSVLVERFAEVSDPRLKRHVRHDDRSWLFATDTRGLTIAPVDHAYNGPLLDQQTTGKCTAECFLNLCKSGPYYSSALHDAYVARLGSFDDTATDKFYNLEENHDGDGPFPPNDNGSNGLTMAWVGRSLGLIPGWTQVFTPTDFLKALTVYPIGCGTYWYKSMFEPDSAGRVTVDARSGVAGGHQYACLGYDGKKYLKFVQSWGQWGNDGFFYVDVDTWFANCLNKRGDGTVLTPPTAPAPVPVESAFDKAAKVLDPWSRIHHTSVADNHKAAIAWQTYAASVRG